MIVANAFVERHTYTKKTAIFDCDLTSPLTRKISISAVVLHSFWSDGPLTDLQEYAKQVLVLQTRRKTQEEGIQTAKTAIENFTEENKDLIAAVDAEIAVLAINRDISDSYSSLVRRLNRYKERLPGQLVADLGDTVVTLYSAFNRNDAPLGLLANVRLPLEPEQRILVAFQPDPEKYFDALHILSEGHIRCIGLAILLAKNLKENCPVLIFDDPVNAIDDEHRESIRKSLFEDNFFENRQIILTCHGEEFFKDIQNLLGAERSEQARRLTFLPSPDENHIRIDFNSAPRNYVLAATEHLDHGEIREALAKSRQALESLTKGKVWPYLNRHGDGNLSVKMRSAKTPIELRNLTEQLKSKLSRPELTHEAKDRILAPIDKLLGIGGDSREWKYLNKGTHDEEDREEFDRAVVGEIVRFLSDLDGATA